MTGLQNRVDSFGVDAWRQRQRANPGRPVPRTALAGDISQLHNPYAGIPYAWQLTETVEDFLDRLPPETTTSDQVPWIFICNPYIPRVGKRQSDKWQVKGRDNDDEGPDEEGANVQIVVQGGEERLQLVRDLLEKASQTNMGKSVKEREANKERRQAAADILTLGHAYRVRAGKVPSYEHILDYAIREKLTVNSPVDALLPASRGQRSLGYCGKSDRSQRTRHRSKGGTQVSRWRRAKGSPDLCVHCRF